MDKERQGESRGQRRRREIAEAKLKATQRRAFLKWGGVGLAATGLGAIAYALGNQEKRGSDFPEVVKYYPELARYPVKNAGEISLPETGRNIRYYNFTRFKLQIESLQLISGFLQGHASESADITYDVYAVRAEISLNPRGVSNHVIFIAPNEAQNPKWLTDLGATQDTFAATNTNFPGITATFVRAPEILGEYNMDLYNQIVLNGAILTELCNSIVDVRTRYPDGHEGELGQELTCNSLSLMYEHRQAGSPYSAYLGEAATTTIYAFDIRGVHPVLIYPESSYNNLPDLRMLDLK